MIRRPRRSSSTCCPLLEGEALRNTFEASGKWKQWRGLSFTRWRGKHLMDRRPQRGNGVLEAIDSHEDD